MSCVLHYTVIGLGTAGGTLSSALVVASVNDDEDEELDDDEEDELLLLSILLLLLSVDIDGLFKIGKIIVPPDNAVPISAIFAAAARRTIGTSSEEHKD